MAKRTKRAGRFSAVRRIIEDDYKEADDRYPISGTVIPSALSDDKEHSGVRFDVHAKRMNGTNLVIEDEGNIQTIHVPARAMEILRKNNKDGKRMNYAEAIELAKKEEAEEDAKNNGEGSEKAASVKEPPSDVHPNANTGVEHFMPAHRKTVEKLKGDKTEAMPEEPEGPPVNAILPSKGPPTLRQLDDCLDHGKEGLDFVAKASGLTPVATPTEEEEPEYMKAQRTPGKGKKGRKSKAAPAARPSPKVPVHFSSALGSIGIMAERAFVGGPNGVCLVIIQYSPEGNFYIPPQTDEPVVISLEGKVYKCLTGIYYQIPGTPVMHTVYFIKE